MERYIRIVLALILIFFFSAMFLIKPVLRLVYPIRYREIIVTESVKRELDPFLVASIIQTESGFRPNVISSKGATGLMQLMPDTAKWIIEHQSVSVDNDDLTDPATNIAIGTAYLKYLASQFPLPAALAAYNGGQGNVRQWLESGRWDGTLANLDQIPFVETKRYVRKVLVTRDFFEMIYKDHWEM